MNTFLKSISLCLISIILWQTLMGINKNFALLLSTLVCCAVMALAYTYLEPVLQYFSRLQQRSQWNTEAAQIILKSTGVGMIAELTALICTDSGNSAIAKSVRTISVAAILWLSMPMFTALLDMIDSMIGGL